MSHQGNDELREQFAEEVQEMSHRQGGDTMNDTHWHLLRTESEDVVGWQILDSEGSVHSQHWSREDALGMAAVHAEDSEALAADLHAQADDAQEISDGLRGLIDRASDTYSGGEA